MSAMPRCRYFQIARKMFSGHLCKSSAQRRCADAAARYAEHAAARLIVDATDDSVPARDSADVSLLIDTLC